MLAYFFPPIAASGSMRPAAFCAHLADCGYSPHVISADIASASDRLDRDDSLLDLLPPGLAVDRLRYTDRRDTLLRWRHALVGRHREHDGRGAAASGPSTARRGGWFDERLKHLAKRVFMFPDEQKDWGPAVRHHVGKLATRDRPDVVFATGSPWTALLTGLQVARSLDVPFVADFRDPWAVNLKAALGEGFQDLAAQRERDILEGATRVIANTEALRQHFSLVCPHRTAQIVTLNNGINHALIDAAGISHASTVDGSRIELSYFGSITRSRIPGALLHALDELHQAGTLDARALRLRFTGAWAPLEPALAAVLARLESAGIVLREPAVPYAECLVRMRRADHLLILQQGFPLQIPAKIYEYMAMRRPMVIIGGEGATADLVERERLGVICPDRVPEIKELLRGLVSGGLQVPAPSAATVAAFSYSNLTQRLAAIFDEAIEEYGRR